MNATPSANTILNRLRSETAAAHLRIESAIDLNRVDFSVDDLRTLLIGFHGFHRAWEPVIAHHFRDDIEWFDPRRKLTSLESDLRDSGVDPNDPTLPVCKSLPRITDRFEALGSMYVLEGSTLGGQLVGRFLSKQLALPDGRGHRYFLSYGSDVGVMWRRFTERLLLEIPDFQSEQADRVIASANETFNSLTNWLVEVREGRQVAVVRKAI